MRKVALVLFIEAVLAAIIIRSDFSSSIGKLLIHEKADFSFFSIWAMLLVKDSFVTLKSRGR